MIKSFPRTMLLLISLSFIAACATTSTDKTLSDEGLVRVKDWNIDQVWVKPGFAPAVYSRIMINGTGIDFRSVKDRTTPYDRSSSSYPLSEPNQEKLKQIIVDEFSAELKNIQGYEFTNTPGAGTLSLDIQFIDVVSNVPEKAVGRSTVYLSEVGRATLALTFVDSDSGEVLAAIIDRRSAESYDGLGFKESTPANNWAAVRQLAKHWAKGLGRGLDEMKNSPVMPE